jgi:quinoprotein glucose dehydrogenase
MRCHRAGDGHEAGGEAGPNLAGVATRGDLKYLLEAMIVPSAKVAPGFGIVSATLRNNTVVAGIMLEETKDTIDIDVGDKISRVKRSDIKEMTAPVSAMPPMSALLKPREARDLLAWLSTLKKPAPVKKSDKKVVPVLISRIQPHALDSLLDDSSTKSFFIATAEPKDVAISEVKTASTPVLEAKTAEVAAVSEETMKAGKAQFALCQACHGSDGGGVANVAPPLAASEWINGPPENLIRIQLRGLQGPIKVKGIEYSLMMPPQAYQSDEQIASVLSYVRNSFGNKAAAITVDQVTALRGEVGKPMLTAGELISPPTMAAKPDTESSSGETASVSKTASQKNSLSTNLGLPLWTLALLAGWVGFCVIAGLVKHD